MEILPFRTEFIPEAASLFIQNFKQLRQTAPVMPPNFEDHGRVEEHLKSLFAAAPGVAAVEGGRLTGYIGVWPADDLRDTGLTGVYSPEWGHAALEEHRLPIYRALYRSAAALWTDAGARMHALSLLAHDRVGVEAWFWNGFGLTVVDAMRWIEPVDRAGDPALIIRKASVDEAEALSQLDVQHNQHYVQPPVFMAQRQPQSPAERIAFMQQGANSIWAAYDREQPVGFIQFESDSTDASILVRSKDTVAITGAYLQPAYRRQGLGRAILFKALGEYARLGFRRCSVDFESFNPEAASFWPRFFQPVCYSLTRIPESFRALLK